MFTREELKQNLTAIMEIALFMPGGVERYSPTKSAAIRSFIVPALFLPLVIWIWVVRAETEPVSVVVAVHFIRMLLSIVIFFGLIYLLSRQYERQEHFYRFVTASNWHELMGTMMAAPIILALFTGGSIEVWENYAIFVQILGYVYTGFIATHVFKLPWEMGGFIGVVSLAVMQNMLILGKMVESLLTVAA